MVEKDCYIEWIIEMGKQVNIVFFMVGIVCDEVLLFWFGYFNEEEKVLLKKQVVGDICLCFFDVKGNICSSVINDWIIGVEF